VAVGIELGGVAEPAVIANQVSAFPEALALATRHDGSLHLLS